VFSDTYEKFGPFVVKEAIVFLRGTVDRRRERPSIIVDEIIPIEQALPEMTGRLLVRLPASADPTDALTGMRDVLTRHHGECPLFIELTPISRAEVRVVVRPDRAWYVRPDQSLMKDLAAVVGDAALVLRPKQTNGNGRKPRFERKGPPNGGRQPAMFNGGAAPAAAHGQAADAPVSAAVTRFN